MNSKDEFEALRLTAVKAGARARRAKRLLVDKYHAFVSGNGPEPTKAEIESASTWAELEASAWQQLGKDLGRD